MDRSPCVAICLLQSEVLLQSQCELGQVLEDGDHQGACIIDEGQAVLDVVDAALLNDLQNHTPDTPTEGDPNNVGSQIPHVQHECLQHRPDRFLRTGVSQQEENKIHSLFLSPQYSSYRIQYDEA